MTVWIVNPFDNLPCEGNRPQRYWLMARAFAAAGWKARLWTSDFSHARKRRRVAAAAADEPGVEVTMIPTLPYARNVCWTRVRSHLRLARLFRRLALSRLAGPSPEKPALVVASTPPLGLCAAALDVARACGARFVCDMQDAWPETFGRLLPPGLKWLGAPLFAGMRRTARRIYRSADVVTGVCRRYAALSGREDFLLAYHGILSGGCAPARAPARQAKARLVYAGNLGAGYELGPVVEAVARRPELTLDVAGLGPREAGLRADVRRLRAEARVRFHGYLGAAGLKALLAASDVGVIPMRDDSWVGLPYKLADYLQAGLRVLSSLHGECGGLLAETGFGGTYELMSADSFLAALDALRPADVRLPDFLRAEEIYPAYVRAVQGDAP